MFYELTEGNVIEYVRATPPIARMFANAGDLVAKDLAEGNINILLRVSSGDDPKNSVMIKQALPYSRRYPDFKMPQERAVLERNMLEFENRVCPGLVPQLYYYDAEMFVNCMEDHNQHVIMRVGLMKQRRYEHFAGHLGQFLARTLFYTSDFYLPSDEKKRQVAQYLNPVMCKVTEDLVFTQPFVAHPNNNWTPCLGPMVRDIHHDDPLRNEVLHLKEAFMAHAQALVHGDLHTGSIMVNEQETKVIDPEFGFFGPMGFDIGALLGNLVLSYASQQWHARDARLRAEYRRWLKEAIGGVWHAFQEEFRRLWGSERIEGWASTTMLDEYLRTLLRDTAGFAAAKIMRRIIGLAHVPDLWTIEDEHERGVAESIALNVARAWLLNRNRVETMDELLDMLERAQPDERVVRSTT